ncbi:response regulator [Leptolyngbya sp. FACHB-261]|uniref:response regulator n=1 Tax=Leptolyngbya sp. FACHB-261 TaxID=2692806 RepID=UPI00168738B1|nr:response regulator [Leptolyngbya sp. FACHB-261]MBD2104438.1 response regulator [Leptolyngbya sp. FACHB-261]
MLTSEADFSEFDSVAEAQLQQELRSLFELDTQKYLQLYVSTAKQLRETAWVTDIQQLYRCVHTIKGGAVTVGAEAILQVASVLEDLLSDLRYRSPAPPLADGQLRQILLEGGELLTGSLQVPATSNASLVVQPTVERIEALRELVRQRYLPEWDEQQQLWQEFAEQGFDLVVLELEMALEQLPAQGSVPPTMLEVAKRTLRQLLQIGKDLEFEGDWVPLLKRSRVLLTTQLENRIWRSKWPGYLLKLKDCARRGGRLAAPALAVPTPAAVITAVPEGAEATPEAPQPTLPQPALPSLEPPETAASLAVDIQIPVPLERLDRSAQQLVETLLATRATQGFYQTLQSQLLPLVTLAQESVQYIARLREMQDDYALLDRTQKTTGPTPERYRQGYTAVNRLLETSLRLIELGAETEKSARQTTESLQRLDHSIRGLQQTLEQTRLVPFETLSFRARGILRDLTNRYGKPAQLVVQGERLELDAGTMRSLEPALLHLLRNAYDHGLEPPAQRVAKGKPEQGTITLSLVRRGSLFVVQVQDDGRGIDAAAIEKVARANGLPRTQTRTPAELLAVLCQSGFSSQLEVSELSGRGVGMDVVATQVASMGGRLSLSTSLGAGTTFRLQIPVPHLLVRCVILQAGNRSFAVPAEETSITRLLSDLQVHPAPPHRLYNLSIQEDGNPTPALDLFHYWQPTKTTRLLAATAVCLRIQSQVNQQQAWLVADELLGQSDLLINALPNPLQAPLGLMGVSLQADGKLIPVLEPSALVEGLLTLSEGESVNSLFSGPSEPFRTISTANPLTQRILVVDDAALVRRRIERSLSAHGYDLSTCGDGVEAWNWLQSHSLPALMITDIEMPGMDGFTLIDRCRQAGMTMPILVISSRLSEEWNQEARRLGATDYLTKGFSTPELLKKIATLLQAVPV